MWEKENTQFHPNLAILFHLRGEEKTEKQLWKSQSRDTGSLQDWALIIEIRNAFPSPHHITKAHYSSFIESVYDIYQRKITRHIKRQNAQCEETEQASQLDMAGMLELSNQEFKTIIINSWRALMDKYEGTDEQY